MKKARSYICMVAVMIQCITFGSNPVVAKSTNQVDVFVDTKSLRNTGEVINGTTFVTLETLRNDFRFNVYYEPQTKRISILSTKKEIVMKLDENSYLVNGHKLFMEAGPRKKQSSILVPLRVVCENMGFTVSQDSITKAVRTHFVAENDLQFENKEMKINTNNTNVSIQYPQLKWLSNIEIQRKINDQLEKDARETYEMGSQALKEQRENENPYDFSLDYQITYNQNGLISIVFDQYTYTGGAHGMVDRIAYTIDIKTGKILTLQDLLKEKPAYKADITHEIKKQFQQNYGYLLTPFESIDEQQAFYLKGDSIIIYFGLYQYTPYAAGIPEFSFPLSSFLKGTVFR
ncbi:PdaC/SigV domain-containing protein [Brevibacillus laterosporus]|uniref:DUF4163 domain-containing protein n=1 Tax=Brevibacillus laterosporus TaxID=1465 RepID=A0AAP3DI40_BRELA|nr:DUF4163 domain-containing protein [Brevibacillus laterosporus]MCR8981233.1 DUF4163 domain-containing protein [Brevibacillus laterosporus]MCZ0808387.1 DUF4163 domain-containing protein [Brevibacillus laterosporus]MCZ0826689.1 DUF4163 domain-containing protein [Brevibacillus laterosporus]MCZ0850502.1 DUF4163 domain-containing protein [Brevibacillus laterosporus]